MLGVATERRSECRLLVGKILGETATRFKRIAAEFLKTECEGSL